MKIETQCLHAGYTPKNTEPRVVPIVQSTTYVYDSTDDVAAVFDDPTKSLIYSRFENPTVMAVEDKIAALEGGIGAMCTSSGQAASLLSLLNILKTGDSFISAATIYGGTVNLFAYTLKKLGIECIFVDANASEDEINAAFKPNTKAVFGETLANPALSVFDIEKFAKIAHAHKVPLIIDNTSRPLSFADLLSSALTSLSTQLQSTWTVMQFRAAALSLIQAISTGLTAISLNSQSLMKAITVQFTARPTARLLT